MKELISIVVPAYNIGDYIGGCLDSILAQTYTAIEILVVDDGSKDHTAEVMDAYAQKDPRVKAIHKENGGVTSARLRGIREASGEWIGFVDGDDCIEPDMYERLLANAHEHKADISHCGYQMVFPSGKVDYYYNTGRCEQQDKTEGLKVLLAGEYIEPGLWNKLFHKSLFHRLLHEDVMPTDIRINEDLLMSYYLFKDAEKSVYEDICPYHYVLRKGSAATSKLNEHKLKDPLHVLDILFEDTADRPEVQSVVFRRRVYQLITSATLANQGQKELVAPYRKTARKRLRKELLSVLKGSACGTKLKIMALWAAVWPASYGWVHTLHGSVTGNAHKYDVE